VLGKRDLHHETREAIDLLFRPVFGRICLREAKTKFRQLLLLLLLLLLKLIYKQ
jgi:hypothetical protein